MEKGVMDPVPAPEEVTAAEMVAAREKAGKKVWLVVFEQGGKRTWFITDHPLKPFLRHFNGHKWEKVNDNLYIRRFKENSVKCLEILHYKRRERSIVLHGFSEDTSWQMTIGEAKQVQVVQ